MYRHNLSHIEHVFKLSLETFPTMEQFQFHMHYV